MSSVALGFGLIVLLSLVASWCARLNLRLRHLEKIETGPWERALPSCCAGVGVLAALAQALVLLLR